LNKEEREMVERSTVAKIVNWLRLEYHGDGLALHIASQIEQGAWQQPETPESLNDARTLRELVSGLRKGEVTMVDFGEHPHPFEDAEPCTVRSPKTLAEMNAELDALEPFPKAEEARDTERPLPPSGFLEVRPRTEVEIEQASIEEEPHRTGEP
jgi:hypothetical protein